MDNLTFATDPAGGAVGAVGGGAAGGTGSGAAVPGVTGGSAGADTRASSLADTGPDPASATVPPLPVGAADPADLAAISGAVLRDAPAENQAPEVLHAPGDLVVVVGAAAACWEIALSMGAALAGGVPGALAVAGPPGWLRPDARVLRDRLDAGAARAAGVDGGHPVVLALTTEDPLTDAHLLLALRPDQVWLAVDAGRKEADTAAWLGALERSLERAGLLPAGLAVVGSSATSTPETVEALGLPIGWRDGRAARTGSGPVARTRTRSGRRRAAVDGIE